MDIINYSRLNKDNEILDNQKQAEDIVKKINTLIDDDRYEETNNLP